MTSKWEGAGLMVDGCGVELELNSTLLKWRPVHTIAEYSSRSVLLSDVLSVCRKVEDPTVFTIHWAKTKNQFQYEVRHVTFVCAREAECERWTCDIRNKIDDLPNKRPRRLLVIINPQAGKRKAKQLYETNAAAVFTLADVHTTVIFTERKAHATELLQTIDLSAIDGVVAVGGDGTFREVINGLILRGMSDADYDHNDSAARLVKPQLRLGAMAAGSVSALTSILYKTTDMYSVAVNIILGRSEFKLDISAVFCGRTHLSYSFIVLAMGLSSDFVYDAEEHRTCQCIGGLRYMFPFFKNLFTRRPLKLEIDYKKYEETEQNNNPDKQLTPDSVHKISGDYVDLVCTPSFVFRDPETDTWHFSGGRGHLNLANPCSVVQHLSLYDKTVLKNYDLTLIKDHFTRLKVDEIHVKILGGGKPKRGNQYHVSIDGDVTLLKEPAFSLFVHRDIITCFGK